MQKAVDVVSAKIDSCDSSERFKCMFFPHVLHILPFLHDFACFCILEKFVACFFAGDFFILEHVTCFLLIKFSYEIMPIILAIKGNI